MIEISHLVKKYGDHIAVNDLTLTVEPGKIYGFLGPNGAGKSTTMNIITGYLGATSGEVKINGFDIFAQPEEAKKCVGYLPEIPPLYVDMTVREYLNFVAELKKLEKGRRNKYVEEAMETTGITAQQSRLIRNLSKGYRQRVGFAQAVLGYPEIIILDEPTVGLDPKQIIEIRDLIKELGKNHTVILSSHILSEISAVCDHIFIISKGKLVAGDSTENLMKQMSGAQEIELLIKGDNAAVQETFTGIAEVEKCIPLEQKDEACVHLNLIAKPGMDIREQVFASCVNHGFVILQMNPVSKPPAQKFLPKRSTVWTIPARTHAASAKFARASTPVPSWILSRWTQPPTTVLMTSAICATRLPICPRSAAIKCISSTRSTCFPRRPSTPC